MENVLEVTDLSFSYHEDPILSKVSFTISEKEFVGIIGPNGGGKTTLLLLLMGFLKPSKGKIKLFGKSPKEARDEIGYVPQAFRFDREFPISVLEVVLGGKLRTAPAFGGYRKEDKQAAKEALEKMGMEKQIHAAFSELSGGQAQRVLLARALVGNPKLLFLDEPTANVDQSAQAEIYKLLDKLKGEITVVMVTHDLRTACSHVERLLCVEREVASFSPQEVCEHFALGLYHPPIKRGEKK
jgi:zinc transport system ATP-binding protein